MEENTTLARPYANAAFEHATGANALPQWSEMLSLLAGVTADREMAGILSDPRVSVDKLEELVLGIVEGKFAPGGENFVRLLVSNRRISLAGTISQLFEESRQRSEGRIEVGVISAFELDENYKNMLSETMAKRLGREVQLSVSVDSSLIGGVVIHAGDTVIDASLRGRLRELNNQLG
ncbi:MAG: F0F1 ATP synthase subunit delta [Gammaproteobacteria bacterium]|nr:F0F1 ATP synthase subunit delta [Gammaproteobacteria bacterium]